MRLFSGLFSSNNKHVDNRPSRIDVNLVISNIESAEKSGEIPLGRKIYSFDYGGLQVRFDRDITHNGRVCVFEGKERLFSFTVFAKEGEYEILEQAIGSIIGFLNGERTIHQLPDNDVLKGFYHHQ